MKKLLKSILLFPLKLALSVFMIPTAALVVCLETSINGCDERLMRELWSDFKDMMASLWSN